MRNWQYIKSAIRSWKKDIIKVLVYDSVIDIYKIDVTVYAIIITSG